MSFSITTQVIFPDSRDIYFLPLSSANILAQVLGDTFNLTAASLVTKRKSVLQRRRALEVECFKVKTNNSPETSTNQWPLKNVDANQSVIALLGNE